MGLGIDAYSQPYAGAVGAAGSYTNTQAATGETKSEKAAAESGATVEFSDAGKKALEESKETTDKVIKTETATSKIASKVNGMSESERSNLVAKLQSDQEARHKQLTDMVQKLFSTQADKYGQSNDMWRFLASGNYTVDAETKAQAQADAQVAAATAEAKSIMLKSVEIARMLGYEVETTTAPVEGTEGEVETTYNIKFTAEHDGKDIAEYMKYIEYMSKWDGKLPQVVGDGNGFMITVPGVGDNNGGTGSGTNP